MLSGVYANDAKDFYNIFTTPFENIAHEMNAEKTVQIKDWLGSSVFMKLFQKQKTKPSPKIKSQKKRVQYRPCSECYGSTIKEQKCLLIQKTFDQVNGKITAVSKTLNISRTTVYKHIINK